MRPSAENPRHPPGTTHREAVSRIPQQGRGLRRDQSEQSEVDTLERAWLHKGRVVLKFAGYDTIDQAEKLRDVRLMVSRSQLVKLPAHSYYDFDLVDCEVVTREGERLGRVAQVQRHGAAPLLAVRDQGREYLIPLALDSCTEIDIARKRIVVELPEGLLEI